VTVTLRAVGAARVITVDRAHARNALDSATLRAMIEAARACETDSSARAIVLSAAPPTFVAGGDLREFGALVGPAGGRAVSRKGHAMIDALLATELPLVAAVDGDAYGGGCELAAACDVRIAHEQASFHWVQGRLSVTTGWGATARLSALVGAGTAARWLLGAQTVTAREAHACGFVDVLSLEATALERALAWSEGVAAIDPIVTRAQLRMLRRGARRAEREARSLEERSFSACWALPSHEDAVRRFNETRAARAKLTSE
jgi:enoyl-CoA hydratase